MKEQHNIVYLPVADLRDHEKNPRLRIGDIEELKTSIRANGILQNLTVVHDQNESGKYVVIIGHRRYHAAKEIGLETVPCVISDMDYREQISTMVTENEQRAGLTPYEQGKAYQMMLDFGDTVDSISEKTGSSSTKIRRRLKMAELDADTVHKVECRQISIGDYDRLSEIEDVQTRNAVLATIGTENFGHELRKALKAENEKKLVSDWRTWLSCSGATEIPYAKVWSGDYSLVDGKSYVDMDKETDIRSAVSSLMASGMKYYSFNGTALYARTDKKTVVKTQEEIEADKRRVEIEERRKELESLFETAFDDRIAFLSEMSEQNIRVLFSEIMEFYKVVYSTNAYFYRDNTVFGEICECDDKRGYDEIERLAKVRPYRLALAKAYTSTGDNRVISAMNKTTCKYQPNERLTQIYKILEKIGYDVSDEERSLINGTHRLFVKEE